MTNPSSEKRIYTIGTSNRTSEEFIELLKSFEIQQVVDVRRFPTSERYPHFQRENFRKLCEGNGIAYLWLGDMLGGYRKGGYEKYMETPAFKSGIEKLIDLATTNTTAFCCAEKFPWKCHRRFIARYLEDKGWVVLHILDKDRIWRPTQQELF